MALRRCMILLALIAPALGTVRRLPADEKPPDRANHVVKTNVLYGCSGGGQEVLYIFEIRDYATAKPSLKVIGESRPGFGIHDLAISDTGIIYGAGKANPSSIYTINPDNGAVEEPVVKDYASGQNGLVWARGDILYSAGWQNGEVRRIELKTGRVTVVATIAHGSGDMALDPRDGSLYFLTTTKELCRLNLADGKSTTQGPLDSAAAIAIDHTGQMYGWAAGADQGDIRFLSIDKKTGQHTLIAEFHTTGINAKAAGTWGLGAAPVAGKKESGALAQKGRGANPARKDGVPMGGTMSRVASAYVDQVLDIMQRNSLRREKVDWRSLRTQVREKASGAQTIAETYPAVEFALEELGDHHSQLMTPSRSLAAASPRVRDLLSSITEAQAPAAKPSGQMIDGRWAHINVPSCYAVTDREAQTAFAVKLQQVVRKLDEQKPVGWIIDLRGNSGGNMWPMLAGIGPVLGEGEVGANVYPNRVKPKWYYSAGKAGASNQVFTAVPEAYRLKVAKPAVAVLTGKMTASSGEAIVIAFRGRPRTRSFGQPTFGVSTSNQPFSLSDGSILNLTTAAMADRTGKVYGGAVEPDEKVEGDEDAVLKAAVAWLEKQAK